MNLYIMSRGRAGFVRTLASIPPSWLKRTFLVVPAAEAVEYATKSHPAVTVLGVREDITNYSQKFQAILRAEADVFRMHDGPAVDKAVILDDDLVFSQREGLSLKTITDPRQLAPLWEQMEALLETYPLVGVHPRQMGQYAPPGHVENGRIICIQGINRRLIGPVQVDQFPILADVVLNLSLLSRGDKNALITDFFQDHGPCQAPGGCSLYRTPAMQEQAIDYLVERWGPYVRKTIRKPKVAKWMGDTRVEFTAQWKKLHRDAPEKK